jgi:hypothetical protein
MDRRLASLSNCGNDFEAAVDIVFKVRSAQRLLPLRCAPQCAPCCFSTQGVFVHRYRDSAPAIRCDTLAAFGAWLASDPEHFLQNSYLKYVGWMLSDSDAPAVRLQVRIS